MCSRIPEITCVLNSFTKYRWSIYHWKNSKNWSYFTILNIKGHKGNSEKKLSTCLCFSCHIVSHLLIWFHVMNMSHYGRVSWFIWRSGEISNQLRYFIIGKWREWKSFFYIVICFNATMIVDFPVYKSVLNYSFGFPCVNKTLFPSFKYKFKINFSYWIAQSKSGDRKQVNYLDMTYLKTKNKYNKTKS